MYRIELTPGEEALFRTIDELAKAIHSGVVGSHARVWHGASNKWLPIDFHPHYKIAKERPLSPAGKTAAASTPTSTPAPAPASAPAPARFAPPPAAVPAEPVAKSAPAPAPVTRTREIQFIAVQPPAAPAAPQAPPLVFLEGPHAERSTPRHIEALVAMAKDSPAPMPASGKHYKSGSRSCA